MYRRRCVSIRNGGEPRRGRWPFDQWRPFEILSLGRLPPWLNLSWRATRYAIDARGKCENNMAAKKKNSISLHEGDNNRGDEWETIKKVVAAIPGPAGFFFLIIHRNLIKQNGCIDSYFFFSLFVKHPLCSRKFHWVRTKRKIVSHAISRIGKNTFVPFQGDGKNLPQG